MTRPFTLALPGGRLLEPSLAFLAGAGWPVHGCFGDSRDLVAEPAPGLRLVLVRPMDVPAYVEAGAADAGIAGRDVLLERDPAVYELADLGFGFCRIVLAAPAGEPARRVAAARRGRPQRPLRVATKYPRLTERLLASRGYGARVIALAGHVELAPRVGLAEAIVDLVDTGRTLAANGLAVVEELAETTARLIAHPAAYRTRREVLAPLLARAGALRAARAGTPATGPAGPGEAPAAPAAATRGERP